MNESHLAAFIGPQADYYVRAAETMRTGSLSFNPAAFLGGVLWMGYRKMYGPAFVTLLLLLLESFAEDLLFPGVSDNQGFSMASTIACNTLIGFIGNRLYVWFAVRKVGNVVASAAPNSISDDSVLTQLRVKGGVAWYGPLLVLGMILGIALLLFVGADASGFTIY